MNLTNDKQYIPQLFENNVINAIILLIIPAVFYTLASYGHLYLKNIPLYRAILLAILFATLEYIIRVPIVRYSSEVAQLSNFTMQIIWIVMTLLLALLLDMIFGQTTINII